MRGPGAEALGEREVFGMRLLVGLPFEDAVGEGELVERAAQLKETVDTLAQDTAGSHLARTADKKLKEIEKSAKTIRSEFGGTNDETPLESPPASLDDALKQLKSTGERLNTSMEKTSRHVVSATVVVEASEIIQLVKIIRSYVN